MIYRSLVPSTGQIINNSMFDSQVFNRRHIIAKNKT